MVCSSTQSSSSFAVPSCRHDDQPPLQYRTPMFAIKRDPASLALRWTSTASFPAHSREYCITLYIRGRTFFAKSEFEIFSREDIFANIGLLFTRKYLPAKISSRENNFPRKYLLAKISSRENIFLRLFPCRKYLG